MTGPAMRRWCDRRGGEDGATAVEFAILIIPLLIGVLGLIAMGSMFWVWNTLQLAVDEGARYAMVMFHPAQNPPSWSCNGGTLESCVVADVKQTILGYRGYVFVDLSSITVTAYCYQNGVTGTQIACNTTSTPVPDTMKIGAKLTFSLFSLVDIPLAAGTIVPLSQVSGS